MNPGQGAALKGAPGHKIMEDFHIIKSYSLKIGVMQFENGHNSFLEHSHSTSTALNASIVLCGNSVFASS